MGIENAKKQTKFVIVWGGGGGEIQNLGGEVSPLKALKKTLNSSIPCLQCCKH